MLKHPKIGIDLMGGTHSPSHLLTGLIEQLTRFSSYFELVLFCNHETKEAILPLLNPCSLPYTIISSSQTISLEDPPLFALKNKKDSSLFLGLSHLKEKKIDAFVSLGNTGALLSIAHFHLSLLPGIDRPALLTHLPTKKKPVTLLDVGARATATAPQLAELALIGSAYLKALGHSFFQVGLLNIGEEEHKGTPLHKEAFQLIQSIHEKNRDILPSFFGNIEPQAVFEGNCDLVITDGFSGNIFLKSAEGTAEFIRHIIAQFDKTLVLKKELKPLFEHENYPGALLAGLDGIIFKCHSDFSGRALYSAVQQSLNLLKGNFLDQIKHHLESKNHSI